MIFFLLNDFHIRKYLYLCSQMISLKEFNIDLKALSDGNTVRSYTINDGFFETLDTLDVKGGDIAHLVTLNSASKSKVKWWCLAINA